MAEKDKDDAVIELDEGDTVTVDVSDKPELAVEAAEGEPKVVEGLATEERPPKKAVPRVRLGEPKSKAEEAAATALAASAKEATARLTKDKEAAEATATAERARAEAAQRLAAEKDKENAQLRETVEDRELAILNSGIESATRELTAYETEMSTALEGGDFKKVSSIQTKQSRAAAQLDRLEAAKADYEAGRATKKTIEARVEPTQQVAPFEQFVRSFAPAAQAWLRTHPECAPAQFGGNAQSNAKMMAGHFAAISENVAEGTPRYFEIIEEHTGHRQAVSAAAATTPAEEAEAEEPVVPAKKATPKIQPSAPVTRDPPAANGLPRTTRSVTLTKEQQDAAKISFPHLTTPQAFAQYARNLIELEAEGKMGRTSH